MLLLPSSILLIATVFLTVALCIVNAEQKRGSRLFLPRARGWLDHQFDNLIGRGARIIEIVSISIMYLWHQFRAALARMIAPRPRKRKQPQRIVFEKTGNHLSDMHDHKSDTALSKTQKKKLRNQKLEERL